MMTHINENMTAFQRANSQGLIAQVMVMSHFVQKSAMDKLIESDRYEHLSLAFEGYILLLAERAYSPGELAQKLGITKQACSKTIRELEKLDLIEGHKNPNDSRSRILSLTPKGVGLAYDGIEVTTEIQQQLARATGGDQLDKLLDILEKLCRNLEIDIPSYEALEHASNKPLDSRPTRLTLLLPKLSHYIYQALIESLTKKGFKGLKPNFSQVMGMITPEGGRIQHISSVIGVSKQAIAVIATELEQLNYLTREPDPHDKRQIILRLSSLGQQLLNESTACVNAVELRLRTILSAQESKILTESMAALYLHASDHYEQRKLMPAKIEQLSQQLLSELGSAGARMLAQQLLTITRGKS